MLISMITLIALLGVGESVYFEHPVPIPASPLIGRRGRESSYQKLLPIVEFFLKGRNDGTYHFGFDTGSSAIYREERREASGRVVGKYGYVDPQGVLRITEYESDAAGYRAKESQHVLFDTSNLLIVGPLPISTKTSRRKQMHGWL